MNNDEENTTRRYSDFSEDEEIIEGFRPGSHPEEWLGSLSEELQRALRRKNPTSAIKQLLAFGITTQAYQARNILKQLRAIYLLFIINIVLIGIAIYMIAKS